MLEVQILLMSSRPREARERHASAYKSPVGGGIFRASQKPIC